MILLGLFIVQLRVGNFSLMFQLGHLLIGLVCLILPVMTVMTGSGFRKDFGLVRSFHSRVILLDLMQLSMNDGGEGVSNLAYCFLRFKLELTRLLGRLDLILKVKTGFAFAGFLIKDALLLESPVRGQLLTGGIQTLMRLFRFSFEILNPLRVRDSIVHDRLCGSSFSRLRKYRIRVNCLNRRGLAQLVRNNRFCNDRAGMGGNAVQLQNRRFERCFWRRQRFGYILGWFFRLFLFCDRRFGGRLSIAILGVFRLKLTLLTAHLHLFLFLRRNCFGRGICLNRLDQLCIFRPP